MVIALLAVLGVDLIVIARVEVATAVDSRERALGPMVAPAPPPSEEVRAPPAAARAG